MILSGKFMDEIRLMLTLADVVSLVAITKFNGFVDTCRGTRGYGCTETACIIPRLAFVAHTGD